METVSNYSRSSGPQVLERSFIKLLGSITIRYSLVVIFELNSVPGVQYKNVIIIDDGKYQ